MAIGNKSQVLASLEQEIRSGCLTLYLLQSLAYLFIGSSDDRVDSSKYRLENAVRCSNTIKGGV